LFLIVFIVLNSFAQLFAQAFENGQLYVYVLNPNSIPTFEKDGEKIIINCSNQGLQTLMTQYEVYSFERAFPIVDNFTQTEKYDLERVYLLKCIGDEESLMQIFNNDFLDSYDFSELVPIYYLTSTPNDYHLWDGTLGPNYALDIVNANSAWDITTGISTSVIGISDNGFEVTNPELVGKIDFCINNVDPTATHGTFVAGIAAANTNNNLGMSSIGYNCHLALDGNWGLNGYNAILNFSLLGIKVVNASWGSCGYSRAHEDAVNFAFDNGTLLICGAGNGTNPDGSCNSGGCAPDCNGYFYPASYDRALSVTSVGPNLSHINSNGAMHTHNDKVDVCAAGYDVISIGRGYDGNFACYKSSGTSFAAPYVAGLAGLIYSINPNFTPEQVYHIIKSTTQNIDAQNPQFVGLIGTGLIDAEAAVLMAQDITNDPGNNYNVYNGQNLLWDEDDIKVVNSYIHIYPGGTLTIKGDVYLKSNAVIIVERGASLYLDGAFLTSHGIQNWEGIKVWGNYYLDQVPQTNQGFLNVYNNSTIANANIGIKVGDGNGLPSSLSHGGGIIQLENSTLVNNKNAVVFTSFRRTGGPLELANKSYIRNIDFTWDKSHISDMVFLTLVDVNINDISGNRFCNKMGNNQLVSENNGIGILSNLATFTVKSLNDAGSSIDTYFYNLFYGIRSNSSNPVQTFNVENALFEKVFKGIYANGSNGLRITSNTFHPFNIPDINITAENAYGLYMNGCTGYTIENNVFENWLGSSQIRKIVGLIVNNSGSAYNLINDNSFSNLKVGVLAQNQNRGSLTPETGLVIKCNYFSHNKNDVAVTGGQIGQGYGIGYYQGTNVSISSPAGNLFGHAFQGTTSDYHNESQNILYVHHSPSQDYPELIPWYYTSSTISLVNSMQGYQPGVSCSLVIPTEKEELKTFVEAKEASAEALNEILTESIDQGNTVLLENSVFSSTPDEAYTIYQELMQTGSYVSNDVLSAAIQKEDVLNETMIRDLLVSNPHAAKSPELMDLVGNRENQLPDDMVAQIEEGFNVLSAKESLELQISLLRLEASIAEKELIHQYKSDTAMSNDSLLLFLSSRNRPDAFIQLAFEYLKANVISDAVNSINSINTLDLGSTELELRNKMLDYLQFYNVLINEGRSLFELNTSEIAELEVLSEGNDLVASCSRSILISNGLLQYNEPILLPNEMFKSTKIVRNNNVVNNSQLNIYPNPASQWLTVEYDLQVIGSTSAVLNIIDATGRVVKSMGLSENKNNIIVDLTTLRKGIYFCNLVLDKNTITSRKLTVQ